MNICLDAGHSYSKEINAGDPGAVNGEWIESIGALDIALKTGAMLRNKGYEVCYTRIDGKAIFSLKDRCNIANKLKPDCFVSIHLNSCSNPDVYGIETFRRTKTAGLSALLARHIQNCLILATGSKDRGVKLNDNLYVLKHTVAPAVLVEVGFISNNEEAEKLFTLNYQNKVAEAIAKGIIKAEESLNAYK